MKKNMVCNTVQKWAFRPTNLQVTNPSDHWTFESIPIRLHCHWWDDCL